MFSLHKEKLRRKKDINIKNFKTFYIIFTYKFISRQHGTKIYRKDAHTKI